MSCLLLHAFGKQSPAIEGNIVNKNDGIVLVYYK